MATDTSLLVCKSIEKCVQKCSLKFNELSLKSLNKAPGTGSFATFAQLSRASSNKIKIFLGSETLEARLLGATISIPSNVLVLDHLMPTFFTTPRRLFTSRVSPSKIGRSKINIRPETKSKLRFVIQIEYLILERQPLS